MGVGPNDPGLDLEVATFRLLPAVSAAEKLATIIDFIEFCTACHAESRGRASSLLPLLFDDLRPSVTSVATSWLTVVATFCPCFVHALACGALSRSRRLDVDRHIGSVQPIAPAPRWSRSASADFVLSLLTPTSWARVRPDALLSSSARRGLINNAVRSGAVTHLTHSTSLATPLNAREMAAADAIGRVLTPLAPEQRQFVVTNVAVLLGLRPRPGMPRAVRARPSDGLRTSTTPRTSVPDEVTRYVMARDLAGTVFPVSEDLILRQARKHEIGRKMGRAIIFSPDDIQHLYEVLPCYGSSAAVSRPIGSSAAPSGASALKKLQALL
jgi:hypothetical protein